MMDDATMSTLDLIFSVMDSPRRPLDFILILHLSKAPDIEALKAGARSARALYPTTGSYIDGKEWVRFSEPGDGIRAIEASSDEAVVKAIERFLESRFDPREQMAVQQVAITGCGMAKLVTRFHHAAADGVSAAIWLSHQLRVAYGKERAVSRVFPFGELPLLIHPSPVRRSRFAYRGPSHRLWCRRAKLSRARRWRTISIRSADLRERACRVGWFSYNDLLATCALEVFIGWNRSHGAGRRRKVGLWMPVNIRQRRLSGFGNGTSRIRVYARYRDDASLLDKCREVHSQVSWSLRHGEWALPQSHPLTRLPMWAMSPILRLYLNRPWVDMATALFSHAERWGGQSDELLQNVEKIECIGQLHRHYCVAINGITHLDETWLTFTYDPYLLTSGDIERLVEMYQYQISLAQRELSSSS